MLPLRNQDETAAAGPVSGAWARWIALLGQLGLPRWLATALMVALGGVLVTGMTGVADAATYFWGGGGDQRSWDDWRNWTVFGVCQMPYCYPSSPGDDAFIEDPNYFIDLVEETIDDLSVTASYVTFDGGGATTALTVDSLTAGNATTSVTISFVGRAKIKS